MLVSGTVTEDKLLPEEKINLDEFNLDLDSYHNIDIEQELAYLLKEEIQKERASNRKKSINKIFQN